MDINELIQAEAKGISDFQSEYLNTIKNYIIKNGFKLNPEERAHLYLKLTPIIKKHVISNLKLGVKWLNEGKKTSHKK